MFYKFQTRSGSVLKKINRFYVSRFLGCLTVWAPDGAGGEFRLRSDSAVISLLRCCGLGFSENTWLKVFASYLLFLVN
jgi:hypothetical protein